MARTRVPRTRASGEWTEARFWGFLRSNIRLASRKWPPMYTCKAAARRPSQLADKRIKWQYQCAACGEWFQGKETQVDHIVPCGTLKSFEDIGPFVRRLFCEADGLQVVCKPCHAEKTRS